MKETKKAALGVDLGGTHIAIGLITPEGKVVCKQDEKIDCKAGPEPVISSLIRLIDKTIASSEGYSVEAIGIGLPGNHDTQSGICRFSPNFPGWRNIEIKKPIEEAINIPTFIINDVRSATLGEKYFGAGKGIDNLICITIGTGIGGGVIIDGKLVTGITEAAGEVGHITVEPDGPLCNCGNRGCMEAMAAGPAISAMAVEAIVRGRKTIIKDMINQLEEITPKVVAEAAYKNDALAIEIYQRVGRAIGIGLSNIITTLNPQMVIIGGGIAQAGDILFNPIRKEISSRLKLISPDVTRIVPAALGTAAGMIGGAVLAYIKLAYI